MPKFIDITGQRFGRLVAKTRNAGTHKRFEKYRAAKWLCQCDCGNQTSIAIQHLSNGHTRSCGCSKGEFIRARVATHGQSGSGAHSTWEGMKQRCLNPHSKSYKQYGARGITICERWLKFENFLADMGPRPPNMSIDRIDNSGNYQPDNCRWATRSEQWKNSSTASRLRDKA